MARWLNRNDAARSATKFLRLLIQNGDVCHYSANQLSNRLIDMITHFAPVCASVAVEDLRMVSLGCFPLLKLCSVACEHLKSVACESLMICSLQSVVCELDELWSSFSSWLQD